MQMPFIMRVVPAVFLGAVASSAFSQVPDNDAYLFDTRGVVARSGHGLCWRTNPWSPAKAIPECDPELVKKAEAPKPAPAPVAPAPAPAPVAVVPAPKPVVVPPPPPAPVKCDFSETLATDATFAFGKATLTAAAKKQLDAILARAGECKQISAIHITGHTDRIGSDARNQKLSEERAAAVKAYLEGKGVKAASVHVAGAGKSQPLAGVSCADKLPKAKLVRCLAPNRRVEVAIQGTK